MRALSVLGLVAACHPDGLLLAPGSDGGGPMLSLERCNGVDDDGDGIVDEGCPVRLTFDSADDLDPCLDGMRLVWRRRATAGFDILARQLPDGPEQLLASDGYAGSLSCDGGRVAWVTLQPDEHLVVLDRDGARIEAPHIDQSYSDYAGELRGDRLVFSYSAPGGVWMENEEIQLFDLGTRQLLPIVITPNQQLGPRLAGATVYWSDDRDGYHNPGFAHRFDVWAQQLGGNSVPYKVVDIAGDETIPYVQAVDGAQLAYYRVAGYHDAGNGSVALDPQCHVELFDGQQARTVIANFAPEQCMAAWDRRSVALSGNRVAAIHHDVVLLMVSAGRLASITNDRRAEQAHPALAGDALVWQDNRNDNWDLYYMNIVDAEKGDLSPEGLRP